MTSSIRQVLAQIVDGSQIASGIIDSTKFKSPLTADINLGANNLLTQGFVGRSSTDARHDYSIANQSLLRSAQLIIIPNAVGPVIDIKDPANTGDAWILREDVALQAVIDWSARTSDPALAARRFWYRSDLDQLRRSPDGVLVNPMVDLLWGENPSALVQINGTLVNYPFGSLLSISAGGVLQSVRMTKSGTLRNLRAKMSSNGSNATTTVTVFKNGVSTALTVTITAGSTAEFTDTADSVSVVAGDVIGLQVISNAGAGNITMETWSVELD